MSEATAFFAQPSAAVDGRAPKLQLLGDADAGACEGEFCELPAHREQSVINRRVDSDLV